ncbi:hypothetical protein [Clostridium sporogenes]|uniref:hypothetical protein n=1 Tax=Clostridium sporogenes TaxID=1509 RepID=UPI000AF381F2|nr:hypothetical protein [Clostridium sporogenes]
MYLNIAVTESLPTLSYNVLLKIVVVAYAIATIFSLLYWENCYKTYKKLHKRH